MSAAEKVEGSGGHFHNFFYAKINRIKEVVFDPSTTLHRQQVSRCT
jgi:hypothetical protein